ncbi:MAG: hypothetical protein Q8O25_12735 [Sulfurisoma sp.]|nr:hypothetical protein [Sulfurisoma sp.]
MSKIDNPYIARALADGLGVREVARLFEINAGNLSKSIKNGVVNGCCKTGLQPAPVADPGVVNGCCNSVPEAPPPDDQITPVVLRNPPRLRRLEIDLETAQAEIDAAAARQAAADGSFWVLSLVSLAALAAGLVVVVT